MRILIRLTDRKQMLADIPLLPTGLKGNFLQARLIPETVSWITENIQEVSHRSRALSYREMCRIFDVDITEDEKDRLLLCVAEAFETLAIKSGSPGEIGNLLTLMLAGLAYEAGNSPANAVLIAHEAFEVWEHKQDKQDDQDDEYPIQTLERKAFVSIFSLLIRDLNKATGVAREVLSQIEEIENETITLLENGKYSRGDLEHLVGHVLLLRGIMQLCVGLTDNTSVDLGFFDDSASIYEYLGNPSLWMISKLMGLAARKIYQAASFRLLADYFSEARERIYLHSLISDRRKIFRLWPSQVRAIKEDVLNPENLRIALSFPTSSGKTLIAESAIAKELLGNPDARCIYLASTRALVTEIERTLRKSLKPLGIKVGQISPSSELSPIDVDIAIEHRLLCLTPEKLDVFLRLEHEILSSIRLIVVDEGQLLEDFERGQLLEYAIIKLQLRFPNTKIIFLSAVVPNLGEISEWLGAQSYAHKAIRSNWRPTRLRIAEANLIQVERQEIADNKYLSHINALGRRIIKRCKVHYSDGEELDAFYVRFGEASNFSSNKQIICALSKSYEKRGSVLVLSTSKPRVEELVDLLAFDKELVDREDLRLLAHKIRREIDVGFSLAGYVERGVAYHHGDLPPRIRYQVERIARKNAFRFIVATTTLAEGVNLPVSTLIVDDLKFRYEVDGQWRSTTMPARQFWNLAGRAGRAFVDTEGHVILFNPDRFFDNQDEKRRYLDPNITLLEPVESVFLQLIKYLEKYYKKFLNFDFDGDPFEKLKAIQNYLLSLLDLEIELTDDISIDDAIDKICRHSLISYQRSASEDQKSHFRNFARWGLNVIAGQKDKPPELKRLIVRNGFSIKSSETLIETLEGFSSEDLQHCLEIRNEGGVLDSDKVIWLYKMAFDIWESIPKMHKDLPHHIIAFEWINGSSVGKIAADYFQSETRPLSKSSNYLYSTQTLNAAWGVSSVVAVIGYILHQRSVVTDPELIEHEISLLPAYSAYGVDSSIAAIFAARGVERFDSRILAEMMYDDYGIPKGEIFKSSDCIIWIKFQSNEHLRDAITARRGSFDAEIFDIIDEME